MVFLCIHESQVNKWNENAAISIPLCTTRSSFISFPRRGSDEKPTTQFMYLFLHGRSLFNVSIHLLPTLLSTACSPSLPHTDAHARTQCCFLQHFSVSVCASCVLAIRATPSLKANKWHFLFAGTHLHQQLTQTHARTQFIEVDELDIRIYFTVFDKMGSTIYIQTHAHSGGRRPTQTFLAKYIFKKYFMWLCAPRTYSLSFVWLWFDRVCQQSTRAQRDSYAIHIRRAHLIRFSACVFFAAARFEPTCYMSDKIERRQNVFCFCSFPKDGRVLFCVHHLFVDAARSSSSNNKKSKTDKMTDTE